MLSASSSLFGRSSQRNWLTRYEDPDHLPIIDLAQCPLIVNGARQLDRLGEVGLSGFRVATTAAATCDERSSQHCAVACVACQRQGMVSLRDDVGAPIGLVAGQALSITFSASARAQTPAGTR